MTELKTAVTGVCLLSIAVSLCLSVCPENHLRKQVRFLLSLLTVCALLLPLKAVPFPDSLQSLQQQQQNTSVQALTETAAEKALTCLLQQNGISCDRLEASVHISEDNRISITDVSVTCDDYQSAVTLLKELLGEEVHLHVTQTLE